MSYMPPSVAKTLFPIYCLLSVHTGSIQVEAIPTEKEGSGKNPRVLASQEAAAFLKFEKEHRTSLGVLLLDALFLR